MCTVCVKHEKKQRFIFLTTNVRNMNVIAKLHDVFSLKSVCQTVEDVYCSCLNVFAN